MAYGTARFHLPQLSQSMSSQLSLNSCETILAPPISPSRMAVITNISLSFLLCLTFGTCKPIPGRPLSLSVANSSHVVQSSGNPYESNHFFVNPKYRRMLRTTMRASIGADRAILQSFIQVPTAVWLTSSSHIDRRGDNVVRRAIHAALKQGQKHASQKVPVVTFVVYNLPNRDCSAGASSNDVCCHRNNGRCDLFKQTGTCENGLQEYARNFIDPLALIVKNRCHRVPMAFILEPDALALITTNTNTPQCGSSTQSAYRQGIKYAVEKLHAACPRSALYIDAAKGSWLGWKASTDKFVSLVVSMGITNLIRGFAINVSGHEGLGTTCPSFGVCNSNRLETSCCRDDYCGLLSSSNAGFNCATYAQSLVHSAKMASQPFNPRIVIDTSRNGVPRSRSDCANWCNIRNAGVGEYPSANTLDRNLIDSYLWIKLPGESDGCTRDAPEGMTCSRPSAECESVDSFARAPEAGAWFPEAVTAMMRNGIQPKT